MQEQVKIWHDGDEYYNDDEIVEWYDDYKKRKAQKARVNAHCLTSHEDARLVHDRRRKENDYKNVCLGR